MKEENENIDCHEATPPPAGNFYYYSQIHDNTVSIVNTNIIKKIVGSKLNEMCTLSIRAGCL